MRDAGVAFRAALLGSGLEALGRFALGGPYLPELMAQKLFALIPVWAFTPLFRTFGHHSKYYAFAGMIAAELGILTAVGTLARGWARRRTAEWTAPLRAVVIAGPIAVMILVGLLPLLDAGVAGQALPGGIAVAVPTVLTVTACYAGVLVRGVCR